MFELPSSSKRIDRNLWLWSEISSKNFAAEREREREFTTVSSSGCQNMTRGDVHYVI